MSRAEFAEFKEVAEAARLAVRNFGPRTILF